MTPDPATRAREFANAILAAYQGWHPGVPSDWLACRLDGLIAAALTEPPGRGPETGPDVNPSRMATHDALCRFFSAISGDMSDADEIDAYDLWETAKKAGLARQVPYDEAKHSHIEDVGDDCLPRPRPGAKLPRPRPLTARATNAARFLIRRGGAMS